MTDYCQLARQSLSTWLCRGEKLKPSLREGLSAGCFVSLHDEHGKLRGCIGTIEPAKADLIEEVIENAVSAGTKDPRFDVVHPDELPGISFEVSVLMPPEPVSNVDDLDPARYGVVVANGRRRGVLLPNIEGIDSVDQQLAITRRKAAIGADEAIDIWRFEVEKHREG